MSKIFVKNINHQKINEQTKNIKKWNSTLFFNFNFDFINSKLSKIRHDIFSIIDTIITSKSNTQNNQLFVVLVFISKSQKNQSLRLSILSNFFSIQFFSLNIFREKIEYSILTHFRTLATKFFLFFDNSKTMFIAKKSLARKLFVNNLRISFISFFHISKNHKKILITTIFQQIFFHLFSSKSFVVFVVMNIIFIFDFHELSFENFTRWMRLIEILFFFQIHLLIDDKLIMQCYIMIFKTKKNAIKWLQNQNNEIIENWNRLKKIFFQRFSKKNKSKMKIIFALNILYKLKQRKRFLQKYAKKIKQIEKMLFKKIQQKISNKFVTNLNDEMIKRIVKKFMKQNYITIYDVKITIKLIREIANDQNNKKNIFENSRQTMKFQIFMTSIINQNSKIIETMTRQLIEFFISNSKSKRQFDKKRNIENTQKLYRNNFLSQKSQNQNYDNNTQNQNYNSNAQNQNQIVNFNNSQNSLYYAFENSKNFYQKQNQLKNNYFATNDSNAKSLTNCYNCLQSNYFFKNCTNLSISKKNKNKYIRENEKKIK